MLAEMTVRYMVGGKVLAESPASPTRSYAYFCLSCGDVWARVWSTAGDSWQVIPAPCADHAATGVQDWGYMPGSLLHQQVKSVTLPAWAQCISLEHLPPAILAREVEIHIANLERKAGQEDE